MMRIAIIGLLVLLAQPLPTAELDGARAWLAARQEPDGSWRWDGAAVDDQAVLATAIAALALPPAHESTRRAAAWLTRQQADDGALAQHPAGHALALLVLAEQQAAAGPENGAESRSALEGAISRLADWRLRCAVLDRELAWPRRVGEDAVDSPTSAIALLALRKLHQLPEAATLLRDAQPWPTLAWNSANPDRPAADAAEDDEDASPVGHFPTRWKPSPGSGRPLGARGGAEHWGLLALSALGSSSTDRLRAGLLAQVRERLEAAEPAWPAHGVDLLLLQFHTSGDDALNAKLGAALARYQSAQQADGSWPAELAQSSQLLASACGLLLFDTQRHEALMPGYVEPDE